MSNVLVTGGAGFIGSHVVDAFIQKGFSVRVLDNLSTGRRTNLHPKAEFLLGDITNPSDVTRATQGIDLVCHLAAQASVVKSMEDPVFDATTNTIGTLELLRQSLANGVKQFIFTSTGGAIYGDPRYLPVDERHPEQPVSVYGTSKLAAEKYIEFYGRQGLNYSILRLANVYGPRQDPFGEAGVIAIFLNSLLEGRSLDVYGDGSSSRDYVYVGDVAQALAASADNPTNRAVNVGTSRETDLNSLITAMESVTGLTPTINYLPERPGEVRNTCLSASLAAERLGWTPQVSLEEGLGQVWTWMKT